MKLKTFTRLVFLSIVASAFASSLAIGAKSQDLKAQVGQFADQGDLASVRNLIDTEETRWNGTPDLLYFEHMNVIGFALRDGATADQRYWLFRKVAWATLLKAPLNGSFDLKRALRAKEELIQAVESTTPYVSQANPDMYASIRHDTALILMEYARQVRALYTPNYKPKPVQAKNGPLPGPPSMSGTTPTPKKPGVTVEELSRNRAENYDQDALRSAYAGLASDHLWYLVQAYGRQPRDNEELKGVLDALNIQGVDRETILRQVARTGAKP